MENVENLILEHIRLFRNELADLKKDTLEGFANTHLRLSAIEDMLQADFTTRLAQRDQINRLAERISRVEQRLDLAE